VRAHGSRWLDVSALLQFAGAAQGKTTLLPPPPLPPPPPPHPNNATMMQGKVQRLEVVNNNRVRVYVRGDDGGLEPTGPSQGGVFK